HLKENLEKMLHRKLGVHFDTFYSVFWKCCNAYTPESFNYYWNKLIENYFVTQQYLERYLFGRQKSWPRGFMVILFTLGIESTLFVESKNTCIKYLFESSNMSLCDLGKVLMNHVKDKASEKQYEELISISVPLTMNHITIFLAIESVVIHYLRLKVAQYIIGQIKKYVYYIAYLSNIEEIEYMSTDELSESKRFEDEPDSVLACAWFLLHQLHYDSIVEVWKISRITGRNINHVIFCFADKSYCCTCLLQQKLGLDHGFIQVVENYLDEVRKREEELTQAGAINLNDSNKENTHSSIQLRNLLK
ncbi:4255_t:CDS:2, partial [Racocetra persica]